MAFNLNKNEGTALSSKFDLSKSNSPVIAGAGQEKHKAKAGPFILAGLLLASLAAWYFMSNTGTHNENTSATIAVPDSNQAATAEINQTTATPTTADAGAAMQTENPGTANNAKQPANTAALTVSDNKGAATATVTATGLNNRAPAIFAKGSNAIINMDRSLVKDMMAFLQNNPGAVVNVNGYASSEGDPAVNQQISQARADAFKTYLVSKGISAGRINAAGKGIDNPVSSNDKEEGRIRNRRVEIVFQ